MTAACAPAAAEMKDGRRVLDHEECLDVLRAVGWGVLATGDGEPYGVPVGYALGAGCVYVASGPGRKRENLERHPRACLTVCDVRSFEEWRSVVIPGAVGEVTGMAARTAAVAAFAAQRAPRGRATGADVKRLLGARIFRISLDGISGRARDSVR
jgi:nitroimidazol reductase NimA-like FMN-containing flavoprotein (pyridoxamine 5'-phosphate oxidase superfamily)